MTWAAVPGAVGYVVQRAGSLNGPYSLLDSVTWLGWADYGIVSNATYYYKITAMNAAGASSSSLTTSRPAAPVSLTAVAGDKQVTLTWPASVGATGYVLKGGISSGNATNIVVSGITATNYVNAGLTNGVTYYYVVDSIGTAATSGDSSQASATPVLPPPPLINQFSVSGGNFIVSGSGGVPNSTNYILVSTNITAPLTNWTRLFTNQFDGAGNFNFTNALIPAGPQLFYRLLMQ